MSNGGQPQPQPPCNAGAPPPYTEFLGEQYSGGGTPPVTTANYALGFCVPPHTPAQHIYPSQPPSAYSVAPPPYPGGTSLYPDVNQLPQPQTGIVHHACAWPYQGPLQPSGAGRQQLGITDGFMHGVIQGSGPMGGVISPLASFQSVHREFPLHASEAPPMPSAPTEESPLETVYQYTFASTSDVPYGFSQVNGAFIIPPQPSEGHVIPMRPAPALPTHSASSQPGGHAPSRPAPQAPFMSNCVTEFPRDPSQIAINSEALKNGIAPPGCVVSWRGALGLKLYFIQQEGHIISPLKPVSLTVYKKIGGTPSPEDSNLLGMLEVPGVWRLKLRSKRSFCLHTYPDSYVFIDDSTNPNRVVVLQLPGDVSTTMLADLLALLNEMTDLREEQEGVVDKITTGVSTVYTDLTKKINTVVRDAVPGAHKSTKWFRKGTGSLVRMGGNIVAKGMHLLADQVTPDQPQEEESAEHSYLAESLETFRKKLHTNEITYV